MCHLIEKKWLDKPNGWNRETPIFRQIFRNGDSGDVHGHGGRDVILAGWTFLL
jgi:hypothetical protein